MRVLSIFLLTLVSISYSYIETQTYWYGGDGVLGPVPEWDNSYSVADNIDPVSVARVDCTTPGTGGVYQ